MIALGITDGIACGAAVVRDGAVVSAVNEEALVRLKLAYGFPRNAISMVMKLAGIEPDDVDLVAAATTNNHFFDGIQPFGGWFETEEGILRDAFRTVGGKLGSLVGCVPYVESA